MRGFKLFILQLKSAFLRMLTGLLVMAALFGVIGLAGYLILSGTSGREEGESRALIEVALVSEESFFTDYVYDLAEDIPGVSLLCELVQMNMDEAMDRLASGDVAMIICVPDDFYAQASSMQEAHLTVYTDGTPSKSVEKLLAMLGSASGLMEITDAQIMSMYDGMNAYDIPVDRTRMETELLMRTYYDFGKREDLTQVESLSAYGSYDIVKFYLTSTLLCILIIGSVVMFGMYTGEDFRLERTLRRGGLTYLTGTLGKVCAMWISMGAVAEMSAYLLNLALINNNISINISPRFHLSVCVLTLSISVWIHFIAALVGADSAHFRVVYILLMILMFIMSGVVVPAVYLPEAVRQIAGFIPTGALHRMLLSGMWDTGRIRRLSSINGLYITFVTDALIFIASLIPYRINLLKHD